MGSRRLNLFVILFVLGLLAVSALAITQKRDGARHRPARRHPARLRGRADAADAAGRRPRTSTARSRSSATASTRLGVAEPEISRLGQTGDPGQPARRPGLRARGGPGRRYRAALLLRPRAERDPDQKKVDQGHGSRTSSRSCSRASTTRSSSPPSSPRAATTAARSAAIATTCSTRRRRSSSPVPRRRRRTSSSTSPRRRLCPRTSRRS